MKKPATIIVVNGTSVTEGSGIGVGRGTGAAWHGVAGRRGWRRCSAGGLPVRGTARGHGRLARRLRALGSGRVGERSEGEEREGDGWKRERRRGRRRPGRIGRATTRVRGSRGAAYMGQMGRLG
jgi:hypothetical protein